MYIAYRKVKIPQRIRILVTPETFSTPARLRARPVAKSVARTIKIPSGHEGV